MKTVIVVPTYNERENLTRLLPKLLAYKGVHVLVVDDNSPDQTAEVVKKHSSKRVHLLLGEKRGLGVAYTRGMQYALNELDAEVVVEMDADHSHDPADLKRLFAALEAGADVAIGSRYVPGGSIEGWGFVRHTTSWGGNMVARLIAGLYRVRDCTAGFRAIKRWVLEGVDWSSLSTRGYGFQIRLLYEAKRQGAVIKEIPVTFTDRAVGASKLGVRDIAEFFLTAVKLGFWTYQRILIFLLVGLTGLIVNLGVFSLFLRVLEAPFLLALAIGIEVSILSNFFLHDHFTFFDRHTGTKLSRMGKYHVTSFGGMAINFLVASALFYWTALHPELANLVGILVATGWNFSLSFFWAWKR